MTIRSLATVSLVLLAAFVPSQAFKSALAGSSPAAAPAALHIFFCLGQSNMAGAIDKNANPSNPLPNYYQWINNNWVGIEATDKNIRYIENSFGVDLAQREPRINIATMNSAVYATSLAQWSRGGQYYEGALGYWNERKADGTLYAVLWLQGEADSNPNDCDSYGQRLDKMIGDLRADLGMPNLPFIAGDLAPDFKQKSASPQSAQIVSGYLKDLPNRVPHTAFVPSDGMTTDDDTHYDSASCVAMGKRYVQAYLRMTGTGIIHNEPKEIQAADLSGGVLFDLSGRTVGSAGDRNARTKRQSTPGLCLFKRHATGRIADRYTLLGNALSRF